MNKQLSTYLDLLRFLAAILVFISHASAFSGGYFWQIAKLGHEAVVFFFILSGFVIAFVCFEKKETAPTYLVNRLARIYSVALPALLLTISLYYLGHAINAEAFIELDSRLVNPFFTIISALAFFNQSWVGTTVFSNMPYWSLGYEVLYYAFFGILIYTQGLRRVVFLILALMGPSILLYLPIWWMGVLCFKLLGNCSRLPIFFALFLFISSIVGCIFFSFNSVQEAINSFFVSLLGESFYDLLLEPAEKFAGDYVLAFFVMLHIFSASYIGTNFSIFNRYIAPIIKKSASYTFSIYLYHMPILFFVSAVLPFKMYPVINPVICWLVVPIVVLVLSHVTENNKGFYKKLFSRVLSSRPLLN